MFRNKLSLTLALCMVLIISTMRSFVKQDIQWEFYYFSKIVQAGVCLAWSLSITKRWLYKVTMAFIFLNVISLDFVTLINAFVNIGPPVPQWLYGYINCISLVLGYMWISFSMSDKYLYFKRAAMLFFVDSFIEAIHFFAINNQGSDTATFIQNGWMLGALITFFILDKIKHKYAMQVIKMDT